MWNEIWKETHDHGKKRNFCLISKNILLEIVLNKNLVKHIDIYWYKRFTKNYAALQRPWTFFHYSEFAFILKVIRYCHNIDNINSECHLLLFDIIFLFFGCWKLIITRIFIATVFFSLRSHYGPLKFWWQIAVLTQVNR